MRILPHKYPTSMIKITSLLKVFFVIAPLSVYYCIHFLLISIYQVFIESSQFIRMLSMRMHPIMMKAALEFFQKSILRNRLEGRNGMATGAPLSSHCHQPASKVTQRPQGHVCCRGLVCVQSGSSTTEAKS